MTTATLHHGPTSTDLWTHPTPALSVTQAAERLGVTTATIRRYLAPSDGRIRRLRSGVDEASVTAYAARRDANMARTQACPGWRRPTGPAPALTSLPTAGSPVEEAAATWAEAARLEALARKLKDRARPVLAEAEEGRHGRYVLAFTAGRTVLDTTAVRADYEARDVPVPTRRNAPSIKITAA